MSFKQIQICHSDQTSPLYPYFSRRRMGTLFQGFRDNCRGTWKGLGQGSSKGRRLLLIIYARMELTDGKWDGMVMSGDFGMLYLKKTVTGNLCSYRF